MVHGDFLSVEKIREFLKEDIGLGDITSKTLIPADQKAKAKFYYREKGITAGLKEARIIYELLGCKFEQLKEEGIVAEPYEVLFKVEGPARSLLEGERVGSNLIGRMAGIASTTHELVMKTKGKIRVAATRKTAPGLSVFDKRAVSIGGGDTHRFRLDDCVLIKDNHLTLLPSITDAVKRARKGVSFTKKIEVEIRILEEDVEAAEAGADIIMFDNMPPAEIIRCLAYLSEKGLKDDRIFEASGWVTPENILGYADSGVDVVSMGHLTHSIRSLDVKLEIEML